MDKARVIEILDHYGVPYWTSGKNVSVGWVNIQCPFCADHSNHCGIDPIDPDRVRFNCWRCPAGGKVVNLFMEITGLGYRACLEIVEAGDDIYKHDITELIENRHQYDKILNVINDKPIPLPDLFELVTLDMDWKLLDLYLERRNYTRETLIEHECGVTRYGEFMNRMIIPVTVCGRVMAYQAADLTGTSRLKYNTRGEINNFLYGYDRIGRRMILTEGILDAWRIGDEAVCSFGTSLTDKQIYLIEEKELDELYICWDRDAYMRSRQLLQYFADCIPIIKFIDLPPGLDPDEVGKEYVYNWIAEN